MLNAQAIRETITAVLSDVSKDDNKSGFSNPYDGEKGSILLETRMFNEAPLNPNKCFDCLTKVVNLLVTKGQTLTQQEETDLFFGVTKLFQSSNDRLRRMVYLAIKILNINEGEAFIVTSSLTKDMNSGSDVHRANAIRVLSKIVDASMASQIERYLKTAIVDKSPFVSSAALVCGMSLLKFSPDVVRRWVNEVTETVRSKNTTVQFHALALLYELKKVDRLALHKVVGNLTSSPLKSPMAECLLIRYATRILKAEKEPTIEKGVMEYLASRLHHRSEMTSLEAARAICDLAAEDVNRSSEAYSHDLDLTLSALQVMLSSQKAAVRFAAVRTLNVLSRSRPLAVGRCNSEIEGLLSDGNRSIATLALTTLLKTGHETGVERLIKQISVLMAEIGDGFKLEIIKAVRQLTSAYPAKHKSMMTFLASQLREEGTFEIKRDLVEALAALMAEIPQTQEQGLLHLCEFIEDCEYSILCTRILALLGQLTPTTSCPSKFIRFIYNRLILENASVRATAVDALSRIGFHCPQLRKDIATLLESCLVDNDDEIRDRARLYFKALQTSQESDTASTSASSVLSLEELLSSDVVVSVDALIDYTKQWLTTTREVPSVGYLDLSQLPSEDEYQRLLKASLSTQAQIIATPIGTAGPAVSSMQYVSTEELSGGNVAAELERVCTALCPMEVLGVLNHSSKAVPLTEKEAEYSVICVKHIYTSDHIILEFQVTNTMAEQTLNDVEIVPTNFDSSQWNILGASRIDVLNYDLPKSCFTILKKLPTAFTTTTTLTPEEPFLVATGSFSVTLNYVVREEGDDLGYEDSYALEPVSITIADYIVPRSLRMGQFKSQWGSLQEYGEAIAKLGLNYKTLEAAIAGILELLNMSPCDNTEVVESSETSHDLWLSGLFVEGSPILVRAMCVMSAKHGFLLQAICRSKDKHFSEKALSLFD